MTGLAHHLDATSDDHNTFRHDHIVRMFRSRVSKASMSRLLKVTPSTIDHWLLVYLQENPGLPNPYDKKPRDT